MSIPIFSPPTNPGFPYEVQTVPLSESVGTQRGNDVFASRSNRPINRVSLFWQAADERTRDYILSFFAALGGARGPFQWSMLDYVPSPTGSPPELSAVAGGAKSARQYTVGFTWYSGPGETLLSEEVEFPGASPRFLDAGELLRVRVPVFPRGVEGFRVYVRKDADASFRRQVDVVGSREWTEPENDGDFVAAGETPPESNTCNPPQKWMLDDLQPSRGRGYGAGKRWEITVQMRELLV